MLTKFTKVNSLKTASKIIQQSSTNLLHTSQITHKRKGCNKGPPQVSVILCGCGALDGTEISEAISAAIHLSNHKLKAEFFAPDVNICGSVNHLTKNPEENCPPRNALIEGARLARGDIKPLTECTACDGDALLIPGGFGAARTLSDFASKGCNCVLLPDVERLIRQFNCLNKPIGAICIASALVAKALPGVKVTLGQDNPKDQWIYAEAIEQVKAMGSCVEMKDVKGVTYCESFNIFSTPAWMDSKASYSDIHEGIGNMISQMKECMK